MKIRFGVFMLLLALPMMGYAQTTLNFPRAFTASDLGATGFAVVNPGGTAASVTFTLYSASGTAIGTSSQSVPAGGQFARVGTELFTSVSQAGWVQMTSATSGLQGFWLGGDFATFTDGAEAAGGATDVIFPLVTSNTEINVANMSSSTNTVSIRLFGSDGEIGTAVTRTIAGNGVLQSQASALFPSANLDNARYIRVTGTASVCGTAVISGFLVNPSWGVANAVPATSTNIEANFPHVVSGSGGGGNYTTVVGVTNLASSTNNVSITFTPEGSGSPTTVVRTLAAGGALRDTAQSLFNFPAGFQNGWVRISGSAALTGFVAYADSVAGGLAVVPVSATARTSLIFGHIADLAPWLTGIALLNTGSTAATIDVCAMTPAGSLIGGASTVTTARFTLAGGAKTAKLLSELIPATQTRTSDGGFVFVSSNVPLYGIELFFTRNLSILSNVAAGSGTGYSCPAAPAPLSLTSISASRAARGDSITLTGTGFSTTASSNTVLFTGATGTVSGTVTAASATSLTVTVPTTAISGPVLVQAGGQSSTSRVLEVTLSGGVPLPPATSTVSAGATTSSVDIYVPPPAGTLNATEIAVFDVGATSIPFSGSSVEIARGATKELAIQGSGISSGAGTTISVSGSGVTVSQVRYSGTFVYVRVVVDATAATGVRNVTITNTNNDTSVMTGGLFIR